MSDSVTPTMAPDAGKAVIKNADMEQDMQQEIVEMASDAMMRFEVEKDMAAHIKRTADKKFGTTWHVIVGRSFGSFVTHESKHFLYFCTYTPAYPDLGPMAFLVWRA